MHQASPVSLDFDKSPFVFGFLLSRKGWHAPRYERNAPGVSLQWSLSTWRRSFKSLIAGPQAAIYKKVALTKTRYGHVPAITGTDTGFSITKTRQKHPP